MRAVWLSCLLLVLGACDAGTRACKSGTLFVSFTADDNVDADTLEVSVAIGNGAAKSGSYPFPSSKKGSLQVDFPSGYPKGQSVTVGLLAEKGGVQVAAATDTVMLTAGCVSLPLDLQATTLKDMAMHSDGGMVIDATVPPDLTLHPVALIQSTPDLVGFVTKLDGTGSTDPLDRTLTYKWHFVSLPASSTLDDTAFKPSATASQPTFDPDFGGSYTLQLTVTAPDNTVGVVSAPVVVPTIPVFYYQGSAFDGGDGTLTVRKVRSDGTGDAPITCELLPDGGAGGGTIATSLFSQTAGINLLHPYSPAPPGQGLVVFATLAVDAESNPGTTLFLGDENSSCAGTPPLQLDSADPFAANHFHGWATFSPDGKRVAYVDFAESATSDNPVRIATVGIDGTNPHLIRSDPSVGDVAPTWIDDNNVAWVQSGSIWKGADSATPAPILDRDCSAGGTLSSLSQIQAVGSTYVVSSSNITNSFSLYRMGATAGDCTLADAVQLAEEPKNGLSWDFDLAPDGLTVVFASTRDQMVAADGGSNPPTDIFIVPSDGADVPKKLAGSDPIDDTSPHFAAGGRQVIWTAINNSGDPSLKSGVKIIDLDGTHERFLYNDINNNGITASGSAGGNLGFTFAACSIGRGADATLLGGLGALALLALVLRRKRVQR